MSQNINFNELTRIQASEERINKYMKEYKALEEKAQQNNEKHLAQIYGAIAKGLELAAACVR